MGRAQWRSVWSLPLNPLDDFLGVDYRSQPREDVTEGSRVQGHLRVCPSQGLLLTTEPDSPVKMKDILSAGSTVSCGLRPGRDTCGDGEGTLAVALQVARPPLNSVSPNVKMIF